jgi:hypothetical protein
LRRPRRRLRSPLHRRRKVRQRDLGELRFGSGFSSLAPRGVLADVRGGWKGFEAPGVEPYHEYASTMNKGESYYLR